MSLISLVLHYMSNALIDDDLANDVVSQGTQDVCGVAQFPGSKEDLMIAIHAHPREDLEGPVDITASQEMIDGLRIGGGSAQGVAWAVGEEVPQLRI